MAIQLDDLNEQQKAAVLKTEGPLLVLAGAGSGKTTVLIRRVAQLIDKGVPPWAIMTITFTNKAAKELRSRLDLLDGVEGASKVFACTFHSMCNRFLRQHIDRLGYPKTFTIYDTDDQRRMVRKIMRYLLIDEEKLTPGNIVRWISKYKNDGISPQQARQNVAYMKILAIADVYDRYNEELKRNGAVDFDDLILLTLKLFQENPDVLLEYQNRFEYILVDEFQDTNPVQFDLIQLLAAKSRNLCVVGDDDQSIFGFRGAVIGNILNFDKVYEDAATVRLEQNYRSTKSILEAANNVIEHNVGRKGKELRTEAGRGSEISARAFASETEEAEFIATQILQGVEDGRKFSDFCVLYRNNTLTRNVETALASNSIPYHMLGGLKYYSRLEIKDVMSYLCVILNPHDDMRLLRILNTPLRSLGTKSAEILSDLAREHSTSIFQIMIDGDDYADLVRKMVPIKKFVNLIQSLEDLRDTMSLTAFFDEMLKRTEYLSIYDPAVFEDASRIENVMDLRAEIERFENNPDNENPTWASFLDTVALISDTDQLSDDNQVMLMTIHSAKGLEFPVVFLVGVETGILPDSRNNTTLDALEEERRLCYVAVTRAKEELYVSMSNWRSRYGTPQRQYPSIFIGEMALTLEGLEERKPEYPSKKYVRNTLRKKHASLPAAEIPVHSGNAVEQYLVGDSVTHNAFGSGVVLNLQSMGGDIMMEVAFTQGETRRFLMNSASKFFSKMVETKTSEENVDLQEEN